MTLLLVSLYIVYKLYRYTMDSRAFALRMDILKEDDGSTLNAWLSNNASAFFVVKEFGDAKENPHYHAVLYASAKTASLRQSFRRAFPAHKGNGSYSLKECDEDTDGYGRYICKGADRDSLPDIVCRQGIDYTDGWVRAMHDQYWVNNDALLANRKRRAMNMVERLESICKDKRIRWSDRTEIAKQYVILQKEARKPVNTFAARATVNTVACLLDDSSEAVEQLAIEIAGRF